MTQMQNQTKARVEVDFRNSSSDLDFCRMSLRSNHIVSFGNVGTKSEPEHFLDQLM